MIMFSENIAQSFVLRAEQLALSLLLFAVLGAVVLACMSLAWAVPPKGVPMPGGNRGGGWNNNAPKTIVSKNITMLEYVHNVLGTHQRFSLKVEDDAVLFSASSDYYARLNPSSKPHQLEKRLDKSVLTELQKLIEQENIARLNGYRLETMGLPTGMEFRLLIRYDSGEKITAMANGSNHPIAFSPRHNKLMAFLFSFVEQDLVQQGFFDGDWVLEKVEQVGKANGFGRTMATEKLRLRGSKFTFFDKGKEIASGQWRLHAGVIHNAEADGNTAIGSWQSFVFTNNRLIGKPTQPAQGPLVIDENEAIDHPPTRGVGPQHEYHFQREP